jgi:UDPglucose 6-dehydrogenase
MKIGIIGLGVVGEANKIGFEKIGHKVIVHDIKLDTDLKDVLDTEIVFVCVPTPSNENGSCNTDIVENVIHDLTSFSYKGIIAIRSTIEPGFTQRMLKKYKIKICFCPEFLHERKAIDDFINNHKVCVVGTNDNEIYEKVKEAHGNLPENFVRLNPPEAELVKYFNNVYAALRITFANNMYEISKKLGCDYSKIKDTYALTGKTKNVYLDANENTRGYAGMCLPKDTKALIHLVKKLGLDLDLIKSIEKDNKKFIKTVFQGMRK